jgi:hypothetical protein
MHQCELLEEELNDLLDLLARRPVRRKSQQSVVLLLRRIDPSVRPEQAAKKMLVQEMQPVCPRVIQQEMGHTLESHR